MKRAAAAAIAAVLVLAGCTESRVHRCAGDLAEQLSIYGKILSKPGTCKSLNARQLARAVKIAQQEAG